MAKPGKTGPGFDANEFLSPIHVAPHDGQVGWSPQNPEIPEAADPLGYIPQEDRSRRRD